MSGETPTVSHLFDVMTTDQGDTTDTTGENGVTSSSSHGGGALYFESFVVVIGVIGTAANGLILYAMVASKQHKKHELIFNQNAIDLYSCVFLVIIYGLKLFNMHLIGSLGYWLCTLLFSESLLYCGICASWLNLMMISIERYLKVIHAKWSKIKLRKWMTYVAIACAWIGGIIQAMPSVFQTSAVIDGVCYAYVMLSADIRLGLSVYYFLFTYVFVLVIFIFCYGKILMAIRRQARVMAGHNPGGSSAAHAQAQSKIQTNVIKTMILVCAFYAIAWLPEKTFLLIMPLNPSMNFLNDAYYVALFLGFLYICANLTIIAIRHHLGLERVMNGRCSTMTFARITFIQCKMAAVSFCISAPTRSFTPLSLIRSDAP